MPLALVNRGAKKSNSEIWENFQGFSFFEVKLKLIIAGNSISRDLIFKILITGPPRELVPSALSH